MKIEFSWQSTPALWMATFEDYDGAPDSNCAQGYGATKELAAADLYECENRANETTIYKLREAIKAERLEASHLRAQTGYLAAHLITKAGDRRDVDAIVAEARDATAHLRSKFL